MDNDGAALEEMMKPRLKVLKYMFLSLVSTVVVIFTAYGITIRIILGDADDRKTRDGACEEAKRQYNSGLVATLGIFICFFYCFTLHVWVDPRPVMEQQYYRRACMHMTVTVLVVITSVIFFVYGVYRMHEYRVALPLCPKNATTILL